MNNMDISIIDKWPYLEIIVRLPDGQILKDRAVWHIAASQFSPKVQTAFTKAIEQIVETNKRRRNVKEPEPAKS